MVQSLPNAHFCKCVTHFPPQTNRVATSCRPLLTSRSDADRRRGSHSHVQPAGGPAEVPADGAAVRSATAALCPSHVSTSYHQKHQPLSTPAGYRWVPSHTLQDSLNRGAPPQTDGGSQGLSLQNLDLRFQTSHQIVIQNNIKCFLIAT